MKINITPVVFGGESVTAFSAGNHRITRHGILSHVELWSLQGDRVMSKDVPLGEAKYAEWLALPASADEDSFLTSSLAIQLGFSPADVPAQTPTRWRVSRDTIWNRVKSVIGDASAIAFLAGLPESVRLEFLANEWFHSDNPSVIGLLSTVTYQRTVPEDGSVETVGLDVSAILAPDPYL